MPRGDRTGPAGAGPMTGRGAGFCAGFNTAGFQTAGGGFGHGCGRGFGFRNIMRGWGQPAPAQPSEINGLKEQMARIEQRLDEIQTRS
ncbi:MAG: DUF5320 domain-containing protein [Pontiellaceae bacterium]|jgi:hypothetical protein|nr:DUF5320 domain-containing protein [Pontiellaceae bacterium]